MSKPTVVIDARMVGPTPDGHGRYVALLARGLRAIGDEGRLTYDPVFLTRKGRPAGYDDALSGFATRPISAPYLAPAEQWEIPVALRSLRAAAGGAPLAYHSPTFSSLLHCPVPWLSTVHDLNPWTLEHPGKRFYYRFLVKPFFRGARMRFTVSEFSRGELCRWSGLPPESIRIAHTAIDPAFASVGEETTILEETGLDPDRFFLVLSNPKPHKNVANLVRAYGEYRREAAERGLVPLPLALNVAGHEAQPGVVSLGAIPGPAATGLLASTRAFFAPSRYEGFGLPPLEAAFLGTPVVVSAIAPHREAMNPFGPGEVHWVPPLDDEGWIRAFHLAAEGKLERPRPDSRRRAWQEFSASRLGATMDRAYREVLGCADYAGEPAEGTLSGTESGPADREKGPPRVSEKA